MASLSVLTFDAEGRAVVFEVWLDDLQLFLQCDSKDSLSLFDLTSSASTAPASDADSTVRSQWTTRDAAALLAVRSHLPSTERAHFSQYKSAKTLYDAVVARYSSPTTADLSHLTLPYLFPDLAAFATVADLVAHLCTSDARYRAALPTAFLTTNSPPMYITLYYLVTRLPDSLSSVRDNFLSLCPTELTVKLLEERLAAAEKSILAVGASRGDRCTPSFEGCSPIPLLPSVASVVAVDLVGNEEVGAASASSGRRRTGKGKGSRGGGGGSGGSGGGRRGVSFHTFTLDSGALRSFFRDSTTLTPLSRPVAVSLADPSGGPFLANSSTVLPCPAAPSSLLSGLHLPSFSTNLVSRADLQDAWTLFWHHRLGHPSLPRLRGMVSRALVSELPNSLPPLPPGPAPTCVPCVEGRQRAAPHSSSFPPTEAPLQTLHMDVWGPARERGQGHERYFLLVVDDYSRYTTVFPLRSKGDVTERSSQGCTFSLGSGSFSWRSTRSSSVLSSSCEAEIYAGAMAAQELRWLTYLLTNLGEAPRSPPVLYVNNKAMLALCQEHRLEHRTKHIALRYFLARELQQRGQLRLTYVASQANTADVLTKALQPCDHQRSVLC
ncbi:unnamed protein product [Closterium sp. NIES-54]